MDAAMNESTLTLIDTSGDCTLYRDRDGVALLYRAGRWYRKTEFDSWFPVASI